MTRIVIPALTAMIAVVSLVGLGAWNRSGDARLTITLSDRELPVASRSGRAGEHQPLRLRLAYAARVDPLDARNWLPESRLHELGFTLTVPIGDPSAADAYDNVPSRVAWVALEYDGPAWREIDRRRQLLDAQKSRIHLAAESRLVPVDAAADFDTLRVRYPSGHLIMRGLIGLAFVPADSGGPLVHGRLLQLLPQAIAVPAHLVGVFDYAEDTEPTARYEADLAIGKLGLPYLRSARRLQ